MPTLKLSHKIALFLLPFVILGMLYVIREKVESASATGYYQGSLFIDTGVRHDGPIFKNFDFKPGDCDERTIKVKNTSGHKKKLTVRSANVEETGSLSNALTMTITQNGNVLYDESLKDFFEDSQTLDGIVLDELAPGETKFYKFKVCFEITAGNEYQKKTVEFDLIFGDKISPIELPAECSHLEGIITSIITGTSGNNHINGTNASELILGLGGNDKIDGKGGDDCIVGGSGNDKLEGGTGEDIILGGEGNDKLDGQTGRDKLYGEAGNDELFGGTNNDYLDGGADHDFLKGETGTDTCVNGESVHSSCEI